METFHEYLLDLRDLLGDSLRTGRQTNVEEAVKRLSEVEAALRLAADYRAISKLGLK